MNTIYGIRSGFDIRSFCDDRWPEEHKRKQDQDDQENVCQSPSEIEVVLFIISPGFQDFDRDYAGFHIRMRQIHYPAIGSLSVYPVQEYLYVLCCSKKNYPDEIQGWRFLFKPIASHLIFQQFSQVVFLPFYKSTFDRAVAAVHGIGNLIDTHIVEITHDKCLCILRW